MPDGGTLTLSATRTTEQTSGGPALCLSVSDTGVGIAAAERPRIFDPFFTTRDEGTGLGLAIVHAIVDAHRGRIDVESSEGRGTTLRIVIPHRRQSEGVETPQSFDPDRKDGAAVTVTIGERHCIEEETSA
jgi:signal transduction histidine kinase